MESVNVNSIQKGVLVRIRATLRVLSPSERQVSDFVTAHPDRVVHMSLIELAEAAGVSDATALRFTRSIGFSGFNEFKMALIADLSTPVEAIFEEITPRDDIPAIARKVFQANLQLLYDALDILDTDAITNAIQHLRSASTIYVFAVGTSAPLANIFYDQLFRLGYRACPVTDTYLQLMQSSILTENDVVVIISRSGLPITLQNAEIMAREQGAVIIAVTTDANSPIAKNADIVISGVSREIRGDVLASSVTMITILDALYIVLATQDIDKTIENQRRIWESMATLKPK